jgi:protein-L-isoaspartate(D-aspartate) O-methyltransferase
VEQLNEGGKLLIPLGNMDEQVLYLGIKKGDHLDMQEIAPVRFVPLLGKYAWGE